MIRKIFGVSWSLWPAPAVSRYQKERKVEPILRVTSDLEHQELEVYNKNGRMKKYVCQGARTRDFGET